jgi:outer membrane receptor protein involved in Fe transport
MKNAKRLRQLAPNEGQLNSFQTPLRASENSWLWRKTIGVLATTSIFLGTVFGTTSVALAQDSEQAIEEVVVTGSRIKRPGLTSSSPIVTIDAAEIEFQQEVDLERILRNLPSTIPGDNENVNNGTDGIGTVDIRGLGAERNLILLNGRRMTPANFRGRVDTANIPTALIEKVDIITGGASAVYGSDAIAGAVNIVLKNNFEGVDLLVNKSRSAESDAETDSVSLTLGSQFEGDRGHVALNVSWADRKPLLLGQRPIGTVGIQTADGAGLEEFLAGAGVTMPMAGCGGPDVAATGGSTTAIPTRVSIAGAGGVGQFLDDRTIFTGDTGTGLDARGGCSVFNFNPYNYFRTPQEKYNLFATGDFEVNDNLTVYSTLRYGNTTVRQQVAPSGTFGARFDVPLANPFFSDSARNEIISFANSAVGLGTLTAGGQGANWNDVNGKGVVDADDYLKFQLRRRTVELGPRSESYDTDNFSFLVGARGDLAADWTYDVSFQYGESNRVTVRDGYTNLTNIQYALDSVDGTTCANGDSTCVPIDLFGGFGTITPEAAGYARAIALQQQQYDQWIGQVVFAGPVEAAQLPSADNSLDLSLGFETRTENGALIPDECLKLAPASCQGGAGGNLLPISGGYKVDEFFLEGYLPLVEGVEFVESLNFEFGYRASDYSTVGSANTWKAGLNWTVNEHFLVRVMQQEATRAPNIQELFSPITTGLDNATLDPCSVANAANIDTSLRDLCISTGMSAAQVGVLQDIVSGQINVLTGSDLMNPPDAETADTFTIGFVWSPEFEGVQNVTIELDYYDIDIDDVIGEFSAQQVLDQCYVAGLPSACDNIVRIDGDLTSPASGVELFTTNLDYEQAEGLEFSFGFGFDLNDYGSLQFSGMVNKYLTQERRSDALTPIIDCKGFFGTSCDPISDLTWTQRTTWDWNDFTASLLWRHTSGVDIEIPEREGTFVGFRSIDSYDYFDLNLDYRLWQERVKVSFAVKNLLDEEPPILGNEAGDTSSNSGNTFPSNYDVLGRYYSLSARLTL